MASKTLSFIAPAVYLLASGMCLFAKRSVDPGLMQAIGVYFLGRSIQGFSEALRLSQR